VRTALRWLVTRLLDLDEAHTRAAERRLMLQHVQATAASAPSPAARNAIPAADSSASSHPLPASSTAPTNADGTSVRTYALTLARLCVRKGWRAFEGVVSLLEELSDLDGLREGRSQVLAGLS